MKLRLYIVLIFIAVFGLVFNGCEEELTTSAPEVTTGTATDIKSNSADVSGEIKSNGNLDIIEGGIVYGLSINPTIADNKKTVSSDNGVFTITLTGLLPGKEYHFRAFATNAKGTSYGQDQIFRTIAVLPSVTTNPVTDILPTTAKSGGEITNDGGSEILARGLCWSLNQNPTINNSITNDGPGIGKFNSTISNLSSSSTYYIRAYATNAAGTAYGNELMFQTPAAADIEGNTYAAAVIGSQIWFKENLKVSKYRNGDVIPNVTNFTEWANQTSGAWIYYNNEATNNSNFGKLYNFYVASDPRGICPAGWHVPSAAEWTTLITFLGGENVAGGKMKSTSGWSAPNTGASNSSGFSGLPSGTWAGGWITSGTFAIWWSSTEFPDDSFKAISYYLKSDKENLTRANASKGFGQSIRCVKD